MDPVTDMAEPGRRHAGSSSRGAGAQARTGSRRSAPRPSRLATDVFLAFVGFGLGITLWLSLSVESVAALTPAA